MKQVMGWVCAKAVHDGRLLDLPFSTPLCHTLLGRPLERADLALVCPDVHKTLHKLEGIVQQKKAIVKDASLSSDAKVPNASFSLFSCMGRCLSILPCRGTACAERVQKKRNDLDLG